MTFVPKFGLIRRTGRASLCSAAAVAVAVAFGSTSASATDIQKVRSPGGIEAWLVEDHTLPIIAMEYAFRGGSVHDPDGKAGLVNLLAATLDEGAGKMTSQDFQTRLEELSVKISFSADRDHFTGSFRSLKGQLDEGLDLLRLALNEPRFDAEAVDRMRRQIMASIRRDERNPRAIASTLWRKAAFPDHPYGRMKKGTMDSVASLAPDDLRDIRQRLLARGAIKIAVVGSIDAKTLATKLDHVFGGLPAKQNVGSIEKTEPVFGPVASSELTIPQTVIRFGGKGISRHDKDFYAAYLMNYILGGGSFSSWLYREVREKRGLAYSVYTYLATSEYASYYVGGVATRADQADNVLKIIRGEINRMATDGPTEDELKKAKSFLIGTYALQFDTSPKIANMLLGLQLDNLDETYLTEREKYLGDVTIEDVKRAAKRILGNGELIISRVGQKVSN